MPEIKKALVTACLSPGERARLEAALAPATITFCTPNDEETIATAAKDIDVAILNSDLDDVVLGSPYLKWVHCCRAGLDRSARPEIFERDIVLTSSSGRSAPALAEHVLMFMLSLTYDVPQLLRGQKEHKWLANREFFFKTGLYGKTAGIIGLGKTGLEVARLLKQFDMRILGWRRSAQVPPNVDKVYSADRGDSIQPILEQSDYIILCVELNDETWHLIGQEQLASMKPTAFLVNMGRGELVDEPALGNALQNGTIAGAGLDTFEIEPLPDKSPLWDMPNVMISPHITPQLPDKEARSMCFVYQNIEAYRTGGAFVNRLARRDVYTKGQNKQGG